MEQDAREILSDIRTFLEYQKDMGNEYLPKGAVMAKKSKTSELKALKTKLNTCKKCKLAPTRGNLVFGDGDPEAKLMFIGEAPGAEEDKQGIPFVGRAGKLLTKIIEAMGLTRKDIFIANIIKCRPPENRNPQTEEITACTPFLEKQIEIIKPKVIVTLGTFSSQFILGTDEKIGNLRGKIHEKNGIKIIPTYHPAFLLRSPTMKKPVWEDMQVVMKELGMK